MCSLPKTGALKHSLMNDNYKKNIRFYRRSFIRLNARSKLGEKRPSWLMRMHQSTSET